MMKWFSNLDERSILRYLRMFQSRLRMKFFWSAPITKQRVFSHCQRSIVLGQPDLRRMSHSLVRFAELLNRITSMMTYLMLSFLFWSNRVLACDYEIAKHYVRARTSIIYCSSYYKAYTAFQTFSIVTFANCYLFYLISFCVLTLMPRFQITINGQTFFSIVFWLVVSSLKFQQVIFSYSLSQMSSSGYRFSKEDYSIFSSTICLFLVRGSGCLIAAKGGIFPLPIFLKSQNITLLLSLLTILIISSTYSLLCGWSMQLRKKEISSGERQPSLLKSMILKASLISSSENSSRLMSQPVVQVLNGFLVTIFLLVCQALSLRRMDSMLSYPWGALILMVYSFLSLLSLLREEVISNSLLPIADRLQTDWKGYNIFLDIYLKTIQSRAVL